LHLAIGSDHAGFLLKSELVDYLQSISISVEDFGVYTAESADYPDFASRVAKAVQSAEYELGILICGTGIGMAIVANKHRGIRAALCADSYSARLAREHNNANILTLGARVIGSGLAEEIVSVFINSSFVGDRHERRVKKIEALDQY